MRVLQLNYSVVSGGAARAVNRLNSSLNRVGVESVICCNDKSDRDVDCILLNKYSLRLLRRKFSNAVQRILCGNYFPIVSLNIFRNRRALRRAVREFDVVNLHWVNMEMLSISDIRWLALNRAVVWTLHDLWPISGISHVSLRPVDLGGLLLSFRSNILKFLDFSFLRLKSRFLSVPLNVIAPSYWMAASVKASDIGRNWVVHVIPNAISLDFWHPRRECNVDSRFARVEGRVYFLIHIVDDRNSWHKGVDLVVDMLKQVDAVIRERATFVVLGENLNIPGVDIMNFGYVSDDEILRDIYGFCDVFICSSRIDNSPNMVIESMACGLAILGFRSTGVTELVIHERNGFLADSISAEALLDGVSWFINNASAFPRFREFSRDFVSARFSEPVVARKYIELYRSLDSGKSSLL